jgi:TetR/AcrR family transcriptional repressor of mexJK operon
MDRRQRYVEVALALFLEHGFNGVSMDQLVAAAGGSKATLYRYFDSKEALFAAIIDDIATASAPAVDEDWAAVPLRTGLDQLVRATCAAALADSTIELLRLALGEYARFPDLARALYERGPGATYARLRRFLEVKRVAGEIEVGDLQIAAEQLLGGVIGHQQLRTALGAGRATDAELDARIAASIDAFLAVHGRAAAPAPG